MIPHSDSPNIKVMPFLFAPNNKLDESVQAYSIFWPVKDFEPNSLAFRDYLNGISEQRQRSHRLAIWYQLPEKYYA
jgi:tubulin--tyrosine ligase-like protein 12